MAGYTISVSQGKHTEEHSRRSYTPASAEKSLESENVVIYDCGNDKEHFNDFFQSSIEEFNARQKRADRKKSLDYYDALLNGTEGYGKGDQQEKPVYHDVIQIGNNKTNGVTDNGFDVYHWRELKKEGKFHEAASYVREHINNTKATQDFKEILIEIAEEILKNKNGMYNGILIHGLIIHADEPNGTMHLDMRYTMYTDEGNNKRKDGKNNGLSKRVSMTKCLGKLGFKYTKEATALDQFREFLKDRIEEKMVERGYEREVLNESRAHMPNAVFEAHQELKKTEAKTKSLQKKAAGLEAKVSEVERRESKVESDEIEIKMGRKKLLDDNRDLQRRSDALARDKRMVDSDFDNNVNILLRILDQINPGSQKEYQTIEELQADVEAQVRMFEQKVDAIEQRERAITTRENSVDEIVLKNDQALRELDEIKSQLQNVAGTTMRTMVFEAEKLKDGRYVPKMIRDEKGQLIKDENGKPKRTSARPLDEFVREKTEQFDQAKSRLEQVKAELGYSSKDNSYEY